MQKANALLDEGSQELQKTINFFWLCEKDLVLIA